MNAELDRLADRHFRPDPEGQLAPPTDARQGRVLVGADSGTAATKAGQHALWMLTNLLCRQFRLVTSIGFDIPATIPLQPRVAAFGGAPLLADALKNCVRLVAGAHVGICDAESVDGAAYDFEIVIGRPCRSPRAPLRLIAIAEGWRLYLGRDLWIPDHPPSSDLPFAPYMVACFAAGEVFKRLRGMKEGKGAFIDEGKPLFLSVWSGSKGESWADLDSGPSVDGLSFPALYFAGAGAVAQAAGLTLGGLLDVNGHATVVDPDTLDLTNDNRYVLSTINHDQQPKAPLLAAFLSERGFSQYPFEGSWQAYVTRQDREANREDLADLERRFLYRLILSCVDDNGARHSIQNLWPDLIIGGSTYGLTAKAITFDMASGQRCLKCFNPVDDRNVKVRARLKEARLMTPEQRESFFRALGVDPVAANQHLRQPECGQLSEADLNRFAADDPAMSIGFVSVAAGILLAIQVVRLELAGRDALTERGAILMANFYKPGLRWLPSLPESECDCIRRRVSDWAAQWPGYLKGGGYG